MIEHFKFLRTALSNRFPDFRCGPPKSAFKIEVDPGDPRATRSDLFVVSMLFDEFSLPYN
jgi:hypothetical protein